MAYVITDDCVSCGTCAANCPVEAIDMGDDKYVIDQDKCIAYTRSRVCPATPSPRTERRPPTCPAVHI